MPASPIVFSRAPYTVAYYKDGKKQIIRRVPPPLLHNMLPTDTVTLTASKNADYQEGGNFKVKNINPRHPNTLQIEDKNGNATFVPYYDLVLKKRGEFYQNPEEEAERYRYLVWP